MSDDPQIPSWAAYLSAMLGGGVVVKVLALLMRRRKDRDTATVAALTEKREGFVALTDRLNEHINRQERDVERLSLSIAKAHADHDECERHRREDHARISQLAARVATLEAGKGRR